MVPTFWVGSGLPGSGAGRGALGALPVLWGPLVQGLGFRVQGSGFRV